MKVLAVYYLFINVFLFLLMGIDKGLAKARKRRVPERVLFTLAALGGGVGGVAGMETFRHKTKHTSFWVIFLLSIVLHVIIIVMLNTYLFR